MLYLSRIRRAAGLAVVLMLATAPAAAAQRLEAGVRLGASRASMIFHSARCAPEDAPMCVDTASPNRPRSAPTLGLHLRAPLAPRIALQAEALHLGKGYQRTEPTLHADYVELPVLLRLEVAPRRRIFLLGGLAPSLRVSCRVTIGTRRERCVDTASPVGAELRGWDVGLTLGGGLARRAGRGTLEVEARHTRGLVDSRGWSDSDRSVHRLAALTLAYSVPLTAPR